MGNINSNNTTGQSGGVTLFSGNTVQWGKDNPWKIAGLGAVAVVGVYVLTSKGKGGPVPDNGTHITMGNIKGNANINNKKTIGQSGGFNVFSGNKIKGSTLGISVAVVVVGVAAVYFLSNKNSNGNSVIGNLNNHGTIGTLTASGKATGT